MTLRLHAVEGNRQRLDGGSMYGNCPRALWQRWSPPDEQNRIDLACRALLIEEPDRRILCETGIGAFLEPRLRERYGVIESGHVLLDSLEALDVPPESIDLVILSHLHFDHAGGLLTAYEQGIAPRLLFPRARFLVSRAAFERARTPTLRDRASFIPELPGLLEASGRLELVQGASSETLGPGYRFRFSGGHTPGLMLTEIETGQGPLLFAGDLAPGRPWLHLPITMGYDRFPEQLVEEKRTLFEELHGRGGMLFFTHDAEVSFVKLVKDEQGRFSGEPIEPPRS